MVRGNDVIPSLWLLYTILYYPSERAARTETLLIFSPPSFDNVSVLEPPVSKNEADVKSYVSCLRCINNERTLMSMSQKLEPRRT